jgi:hypothetical protein
MSLFIKLTSAGLALGVVLGGASLASAQATPAQDRYASSVHRESTVGSARQAYETGRMEDRLRGSRRSNRTEVQIDMATREALTQAGTTCQVTDSAEVGEIEGGNYLYEATCSQGTGYLVTSGDSPEVYDCLMLASSLELTPPTEGESTTKCNLPANQDRAALIAPVARAANVSCRVDNGLHLGLTGDGKNRYEVGCAGADGFWIDVDEAGAATKTSCLTVTASNGECRYTTPAEQLATVRERFAGSTAPACTVEQGRGAGSTASSEFFEVKCAGGAGYMFRTSLAGEFQQAYTCDQALAIAGGCKLTDMSGALASVSDRRKGQLSSVGVTCTSTAEVKIGQERGEGGREVVEFNCPENPLGLIAYLPMQGNEDVLVQDCISATLRGVTCQSTPAETIRQALTASLRAGGTECTVAEFRSKGSLGEGVGDSVEVKCADGSGYLADVPANRQAPSSARSCVGLPASEQCSI